MKKMAFAFVSFFVLFGFISTALAVDYGNSRKGKYLFRKTCRTCHKDGATATALSPDSKTQAQWERAFKPEKVAEYSCNTEWEKMSESERLDVFTYVHKFAFDSPSPAKCK